jgi:replicative DNA helicase
MQNIELKQISNDEIEKAVLSCVFQENTLIDELDIDLFFNEKHKLIFNTFKEMFKKDKEIDLILFISYLKEKNISVTITEITDIYNATFSLANIESYIDKLKELKVKRNILKFTTNINYNIDSSEIIDNLQKVLEDNTTVKTNNISTKEYLFEFMEQLEQEKNTENEYIKTGLVSLDSKILGIKNKQLITISAYTGIGKSVLVNQLISNMLRRNKKVTLFTLEMGREEMINRLISTNTAIEYSKLYKKELSDEEKIKITDFISYLYTKNLEIYEFMDNLKDIISTIKKEKMKGNTDIIFIDLINRINNPEADIKNRAEYLGGITRKLKLLAGKLDIPIVITAQINRVVEGRQDKRPTLADIKESGGIAEDSDLVLGLYRDRELERKEVRESLNDKGILDYNSKNADCNPNAIELLILKGRNINIGTYSFYWNGTIQRIGNWSN